MQIDVVETLEHKLSRERSRLQAMMAHLQMKPSPDSTQPGLGAAPTREEQQQIRQQQQPPVQIGGRIGISSTAQKLQEQQLQMHQQQMHLPLERISVKEVNYIFLF